MAKKKSSPSFIFLLVLVFALLCVFFYKTNPEFKAQADKKIEKVKSSFDFAGEVLDELVPEEKKTPENNPSDDTVTPAAAEKSSATPSASLISTAQDLAFPFCKGNSHADDHERRDYKNYSICYRESYEQAEWSAYCLDESELVKNASRSDDFREDEKISTGSASLADYKGSGYDRGHLSPAADFAFSKEAMSETFYMSNMSPQAGSFNRGIWKDLESEVRVWAKKFGRVFVISGPVLDENPSSYETIGKNRVSIPKYYYKVILAPLYASNEDRSSKDDAESVAAIAFILPNTKCTDSFYDYAVSIDEAEKKTGIDFFKSLPDETEDRVEKAFDIDLWK